MKQKNDGMVVFGEPRDTFEVVVRSCALLIALWGFPFSFFLFLLLFVYLVFLHFHDCHFGITSTGLTIFYRDRLWSRQKNYPWSVIKEIEITPGSTGAPRSLSVWFYSGKSAYAEYVTLKKNGETAFINELKKYVPVTLHPRGGYD